MQEQEQYIEAESPLSLELRHHGTTQTIAVTGLELGPFLLSQNLNPDSRPEDQDLAVVLREQYPFTFARLTVRYDALREFIVSQLSLHRSITRVRVIAKAY